MEVVIIISAVASILSAISTIRKNRRDRKNVGAASSFSQDARAGLLGLFKWTFSPVDLIDLVCEVAHWLWDDGEKCHKASRVNVENKCESVLDIGKLVDMLSDEAKRLIEQGYIEVRVMLPKQKTGRRNP